MAKTYTLPANIATYGSGPNYSLLAHGYLDSYGALENPGRIGRNGNYYMRVKLTFPGLTSTIKSLATGYHLKLNWSTGGTSKVEIRIYHGNTGDGDVDSSDEYTGGGARYDPGTSYCYVWDHTGYEFLPQIKASTTNAFILFPSAYPNRPYKLSSSNAWVVLSSAELLITTTETDYTLTYNANGGSGAPGKQTGTGVGSYTFTISGTKPTRAGHTFLGWSLSSTAAGASYQPGGSIKLTASATLYAVWRINTYTVSYNANGGSGAPASQTKTYGKALTLSATKPTRAGHTFLGWNTKADGSGASYAAGGSYTANAAVTLYAQWQINTYTVSYNANGGSGAPASQTKTYGVTLTLSSTTPTRTGYTFSAWNTAQNGSGTSYAPGGSYTANAAATLYAQWQANAYAVTFDAQGGSVTPAGKSVTYGQPYGALPVPERPGYRFDGWFTAADGGTQVTAETVVAVTAAQTLYAHWTVQSIVRVMGADGALHAGVLYVMSADGALHIGIVYVKGSGGPHVNG